VAGEHTQAVVEGHQPLHHRIAHDVRGPAADRVTEERVAREADLVVDHERDAVVGVPGRLDRLDAQAARLDRSGEDGDREPARELVLVLDVIRVAVRTQDVRRCEPLALDRLEQRLERRPAVDEHRHAARRVADDEGVREVPRVHRALDDHAQSLRHWRASERLPP
jgi:hypothetical protein